jgi:Transposase DDE domain
MKVETFTAAILRKMSDIGKCRMKFIIHIVHLFLSMRGRMNYLMMERYGKYGEKSYRLNFEKGFDFKTFNQEIISAYCGKELMLIFDPSYIAKSGKCTPGIGYFWSGCASSMKWGLELSAFAIADIENRTAMHYYAEQTQAIKGEESLRIYYANLVCKQAGELMKISKTIAVDAFFSKWSYVDRVCKAGFTVISRLQKNIYLRYLYNGDQKSGKGRPKKYDGKIDLKNISPEHFKVIKSDDEEIVYEGIAHVRSLKRCCKVVIIHVLKDGKVKNALVYFSTDLETPGLKIYEYYRLRYQIEFLFRDAKNHLGLEDTQSRHEEALNFHFNMCLSSLNVAKALHWLNVLKEQRGPFSMADIKTQYVNELLLDRLISIYGKDPSVEKNNPEIKKLYQLGRIAA